LTLKVEEAEELANLAKKRDLLNCVTYTYSGYPMVKHAREIINQGKIGKIRMVMGEYLQEWLARPVEKKGNRQASWRTDPLTSIKFALIVLID
jgi:predicted dehydrogenase